MSRSYTATTKCSPSVDPGRALWSLRDHLLLPEAEACVRQHLPDLYAAAAGVNVWALVAAIVLLSSSVSDIQQLLFCLRRPSSTVTMPDVTETLYCIAVLLYAMREKGINISNRIHYNIFYCLYLQENSCTQAVEVKEEPSVWPGKKTTIQLTHEQQLILSHKMEPLQVVKIMAFAGTGKTSTLVKYAEKWSESRFLYVTFNKSIAKQAELVFPSNVTCKTFHSMAYGHVGRKYQLKKKLNLFKLTPFMVNSVLAEGKGGFIRAKLVCKTLENFFASADEELTIDHVPIWCKNSQGQRVMVEQSEKLNGVLEASRLWDNMRKLVECKEEAYQMTHDGYLKLWQLSKPLLASFDAIFVDEAQDCTPAIMNIVLSQPCGKIFVGDPHQQIYTFRGAVNALFTVPHTHVFYLTQVSALSASGSPEPHKRALRSPSLVFPRLLCARHRAGLHVRHRACSRSSLLRRGAVCFSGGLRHPNGFPKLGASVTVFSPALPTPPVNQDGGTKWCWQSSYSSL